MADNRKIVHGVRVDNKVITDVDELAKVLTPEMHERLTAAGSIEGDWKLEGDEAAKSDKKAAKSDKTKE